MPTSLLLLVESGRAVAVELDAQGQILETGRGDTPADALGKLAPRAPLAEALDARKPADAPVVSRASVVAADDRAAPVVAAVGVVDLISVQSAVRALNLAGCEVVEVVCINDGRSAEERFRALVEADPAFILLAGGTTRGNIETLECLAEAVAIARDILEEKRGWAPVVVFAGNPEARELVERTLDEEIFRTVDNVRPACEEEDLGPAVVETAFLASRAGVAVATEVVPAGAARSVGVLDLALRAGQDVLLLHDGPRGAEAISMLQGNWNRWFVPGGALTDAVALHRQRARELSGVPLMRDVAEVFESYTSGRDLIDVAPPELVIGSGPQFMQVPPEEAARRLVDLAPPRGVVRLMRTDGDALALYGLTALREQSVSREAWGSVLEDLGVAVGLDGRKAPVTVHLMDEVVEVEEGTVTPLTVETGSEIRLRSDHGGDLGAGARKPVILEVPLLAAGLLIDTRGTPVPPTRQPRILPRR